MLKSACLAVALCIGFADIAWAQESQLQLGSVTSFVPVSPCPAGAHGTLPLKVAVCYTATVSCPTYGGPVIPDLNATVAISTPSKANGGTVVLYDGSAGTDFMNQGFNGLSYAQDYYNNGLQVVQVAWADDWHDNSTDPPVKIMKYEACRPATLLNYVYTNIHGGSTAQGGMCAQGHSAGASALGYALAWFGAGSYLDNVVFTSGPVYSNLEAGCQYPYQPQFSKPIPVCPRNQFGCIDGPKGGWTAAVQYLNSPNGGAAKGVAGYTNTPPGNCNNYTGSGMPTTTNDQDWLDMSVASAGASYSYPNTSMFAFLCATGASQNNSASQAELFFKNITSASQAKKYAVFRVDQCGANEEVWDGVTAAGQAFTVSANSMIQGCFKGK